MFPAFVAEERAGQVEGRVGELARDALPAGDVTIEVEYSSLNYKDALAATGRNKVAARYPHVPGIDAAGTVAESTDPAWPVGTRVLVHGYDFGAGRFGGFARYTRVPGGWLVRLPGTLSAFDAMAIGTAGYSAALALLALQRNGTRPADGPIVVTGASGGVGCVAVDLLAGAGYRVVASTGKPELEDWFRLLGASEVIARDAVRLDDGGDPKPLLPARWAGAVDNVGGTTLDALLRTTKIGGSIALCGLVGGATFRGTVMPFILRGVSLLGIDSARTPIADRQALWNRLAADLRPRHLDAVVRTVGLDELAGEIETMLQGRVQGRLVVDIAGGA